MAVAGAAGDWQSSYIKAGFAFVFLSRSILNVACPFLFNIEFFQKMNVVYQQVTTSSYNAARQVILNLI